VFVVVVVIWRSVRCTKGQKDKEWRRRAFRGEGVWCWCTGRLLAQSPCPALSSPAKGARACVMSAIYIPLTTDPNTGNTPRRRVKGVTLAGRGMGEATGNVGRRVDATLIPQRLTLYSHSHCWHRQHLHTHIQTLPPAPRMHACPVVRPCSCLLAPTLCDPLRSVHPDPSPPRARPRVAVRHDRGSRQISYYVHSRAHSLGQLTTTD